MAVLAIMRMHGNPDTLFATYERVVARLTSEGDEPTFVFNAAGRDASGLVLFEVVDSQAAFEKLWNDPTLNAVAAEEGMPPESEVAVELVPLYNLHVDP